MNGEIVIEGVEVECIIGIHSQERESKQRISIDLALCVDFDDACSTDDISDTVNYEETVETVASIAVEGEFRLLERLAFACADAILRSSPAIHEVAIRVRKHGVLSDVLSVGVSLKIARSLLDRTRRGV